jgi:hypothetical protein
MDLAVKIEFILLELVSNLFWGSVLELVVFALLLSLFITDSSELGAIWFFTPHVARGLVGLSLLRGIPKTHEIIKAASIPPDERLSIDKVFLYITRAAKDALDHFTANTKRSLMAYFWLTVVCGALDVVIFLASLKDFAGEKTPYADTSLLVGSLALLCVDLYYLSWMNSLSERVPPYVSAGVTKAAFGLLDSMYDRLGAKIKDQKAKRDRNLEKHKQELHLVNEE